MQLLAQLDPWLSLPNFSKKSQKQESSKPLQELRRKPEKPTFAPAASLVQLPAGCQGWSRTGAPGSTAGGAGHIPTAPAPASRTSWPSRRHGHCTPISPQLDSNPACLHIV